MKAMEGKPTFVRWPAGNLVRAAITMVVNKAQRALKSSQRIPRPD
jgi:hypothetical protein